MRIIILLCVLEITQLPSELIQCHIVPIIDAEFYRLIECGVSIHIIDIIASISRNIQLLHFLIL